MVEDARSELGLAAPAGASRLRDDVAVLCEELGIRTAWPGPAVSPPPPPPPREEATPDQATARSRRRSVFLRDLARSSAEKFIRPESPAAAAADAPGPPPEPEPETCRF